MATPQSLLFDRLATTPLVVAEGGLSDAEVLIGGGALHPAVFQLDAVDTLMRLLEPRLAEWRYERFPNLAPPPYDVWMEWYNHAARATYGVFLRGKDIAGAMGEEAQEVLLAHWLVGGHLFRERTLQRDIIHLGHFSFGVDRSGGLVTAYPVAFANNWERETAPATADEMPGYFAPVLFALTLLHDPALRLVRRTPDPVAQRSWGKRHKRTLANWQTLDNEATITTLVAESLPTDVFPALLGGGDFSAPPPAVEAVETHSFLAGNILVGLQRYPGVIQMPQLVLP